jgi:hypothetical protein
MRRIALLALVICSGCIHLAASREGFMDAGIQKAAFDLQCDQGKLDVTDLGQGSMGVRGRGKQARYQ